MKYLKKFNENVIDDILDKISKHGMKSLSSKERELLDTNASGKSYADIEKEIKDKKSSKDSLFDYDPRKDKEFFDDLGMDFDAYSDEEIEEGRYNIMWDDISDEDVLDFINSGDINKEDISETKDGETYFIGYDRLPKEVKKKFKWWIDNIY